MSQETERNEQPENPALPDTPGSEYPPEMVVIRKDWIYKGTSAIRLGIESMQAELMRHDREYGRTIPRNKRDAEDMEREIEKMQRAILLLSDFTYRNDRPENSAMPSGSRQDTKSAILQAISRAALAHYENSPYPLEDTIALWLMQEDQEVIVERMAREIENFGCAIFEDSNPSRHLSDQPKQ